MASISHLLRASRPRRILAGLKSDTPLILLGAKRSFKALTIAKAKAFRLACDRRAIVLKLCPLAASMLAIGMVDINHALTSFTVFPRAEIQVCGDYEEHRRTIIE